MPVRPSFIAVVLFIAVVAVSASGPLVRLSHAHAVAIAVWRLAFSLALVAFPLIARGSWRQVRALDARSFAIACLGGVMLALHFWSWNTSVQLTTVAASVVLVNTQAIVVGLLSALWLRERPTAQQWAGILIAVLGALVVVWPDLSSSGSSALHATSMLGDALALVGAITAATYYVVGRRLRASLDLWAYVAVVYGACLAMLLIIAFVGNVRLAPYPRREFAIFAALAIGPMLLGHTLLNWSLRHVRAYLVNIVLLGEPVIATVLAALLPGIGERPSAFTVAGDLLVLSGIAVAERRRAT